MQSSYLNVVNKQTTLNGRDSFVYMSCYPFSTCENIMKKQAEVLQKQKDLIASSVEFKEFADGGNKIETDNLFTLAQQIGNIYYKKRIMSFPTKEEQLQAIHNSSEYKEYIKNNARNLENIKPDDVDTLCTHVGYWEYLHKTITIREERELHNLYFDSRLDIVLNKNQSVFPSQG
jgi:hypothetical protein